MESDSPLFVLIKDDTKDVLYESNEDPDSIQQLVNEFRTGIINSKYKLRIIETTRGEILLIDRRLRKNYSNNIYTFKRPTAQS